MQDTITRRELLAVSGAGLAAGLLPPRRRRRRRMSQYVNTLSLPSSIVFAPTSTWPATQPIGGEFPLPGTTGLRAGELAELDTITVGLRLAAQGDARLSPIASASAWVYLSGQPFINVPLDKVSDATDVLSEFASEFFGSVNLPTSIPLYPSSVRLRISAKSADTNPAHTYGLIVVGSDNALVGVQPQFLQTTQVSLYGKVAPVRYGHQS